MHLFPYPPYQMPRGQYQAQQLPTHDYCLAEAAVADHQYPLMNKESDSYFECLYFSLIDCWACCGALR